MKLPVKIFIALVSIAFLTYLSIEFLLEFWWFSSLKLAGFFLLRESYEWLVKIGTTLLFSGVAYLNFVSIPRALSLHSAIDGKGLIVVLQRRRVLLYLFSLLVTMPLLIPVYTHWESFLLYYFSASAQLTDPVYAKNISFYLFSYPVFALIQKELLWFFALILGVVSLLYFLIFKNQRDKLQAFPAIAKLHIAILVAGLIFLQAWSIALERIEMLYEDRHLPVFYGPGFVEMNYHLPLVWLSFLLFLALAITTIYSLFTGNKYRLPLALGLAYMLVMVIKQFDFIPNMIDHYYVRSNPVAAESKYIQWHINASRDAFNLATITEIDYPLESSLSPLASAEIGQELYNIPLWDDDLILPVFEQLQSIRPYFSFYQVAVDRYLLDGKYQQVNVAARELDYQGMPVDAQNWRNRHLVFTHGYGMVMTPSSQQANQPMQWLLQNFGQTVADEKLSIHQPEIYYGLADYTYAIVPNTESLKSDADTAGDMTTDYQGAGGLALSSLFTKAVVASYFKDERIFFSTGINKQSRILVRRNIINRIREIAPFLLLDNDPYPVLVEHKIYWVVDAYTGSSLYPLVEPVTIDTADPSAQRFNYLRNSVKIIVDAYDGTVNFYVVDKHDPIISTYQNLYHGLFQDVAAIPQPLIKHLSYPKAWFTLQMQLYARFQQTRPEIFYQQSEALQLASMEGTPVEPYFFDAGYR